ncbi:MULTISPECIES: hypothetical protein [Pseudomonas]|uniref:Uncharacterized protein n=3 Tax=Pseudomonas TaxID=286 RepID=A0AAJ5I4M7_9PSED|nr:MULTISPECIES: hypothetical protein [Pseudomonas]MCO7534324.1 hypothetical protein [Pseudomonas asiatica]MCO7551347.1 hypothetical protein [Pseudomonas asiatica]MCO7561907.1 hypothetical protein [Pseudomonas asiatica]MCO8263445.1 hypothetical protein [Pseudomonas asiatica]MDM9600338.1 hypothetical protein [Pseudomonas shirazica]
MNKQQKKRLDRSLHALPEWAKHDLSVDHGMLNSYINHGESIGAACKQIFRTGINEISEGLLQELHKPKYYANELIRCGIVKMLVADCLLIQTKKGTQRWSSDTLDGITQIMLCAMAVGHFGSIKPFHATVFAGLENDYGVRDGRNAPLGTTLRYAAFGLTIIGDWLGKPLDLDKHALPRDPAWGQLVAHWREPDPDKLAPILVAACDTHVERIALTSRELDSGNFEFGSPFEAVYPAEILAILNLRRSLGLTNPSPIEHPLMQTPYARLTCPPGMRFEPDELLVQFLAAVCKHDPAAMPDGLYEAVLQTNSAN